MRADPVGELLSQSRFGVGVVGSAPDGYEKLSRNGLAAFRSDKIQPLTIVDEQFLSPAVVLAHAVVEFFSPSAVTLTKLRVLVTLGILFFVLPPQ